MYYFVRVNGNTLHNNPNEPDYYVQGEPPLYPNTYFDALAYCLQNNIIRIGWPDTGDLSAPTKTGALARGYSLTTLKPYIQEYLRTFASIPEKSVVLMPDKDNSGDIYLGQVTKTYHYFHNIPIAPYEHSHRLGVRWLRKEDGQPICFQARDLNIPTKGGFWLRAFHNLSESPSGRAAIPFIAKHLKAG